MYSLRLVTLTYESGSHVSNMKRWLRERGILNSQLAAELSQSTSNITQKVNRKTAWQRRDFVRLRELYGLSSDFVQDLIPYEAEFTGDPQQHEGVLA